MTGWKKKSTERIKECKKGERTGKMDKGYDRVE
jgi:hypothetical protein